MSDDLPERLRDVADLLEAILEDRGLLAHVEEPLRRRLLMAAGRVARPSPIERRKLQSTPSDKAKAETREPDQLPATRAQFRMLRDNPLFLTPRRKRRHEGRSESAKASGESTACFICRETYTEPHVFYDQLCPDCGDLNYRKRSPDGDLSGRVALVTGARVEVGYHAALMLLRAGARVVVTTRFPKDAARRYTAEDDFDTWSERLEIAGLDLRRLGDVEDLCDQLTRRLPHLDYLINHASQSVRRPSGSYDHLTQGELTDGGRDLDRLLLYETGNRSASESRAVPLLPGDVNRDALTRRLDAELPHVDEPLANSWRLRLDEVDTVELLEVHLVNTMAPFLLNARLKPLMLRTPTRDKHIVNVSAKEGQFYASSKGDRHPHTNMARASLNMMTRTSAPDYVRDGIHMNSVDPGWVTDEDPEHDGHPALDVVDGAARVVDPIFDGLATGKPVWGQFLRHYAPTDW